MKLLTHSCGVLVALLVSISPAAGAEPNIYPHFWAWFNRSGLNFSGHDGHGAADTFSPFTVHVHDIANIPIQGAIVVIDVSGCNDIVFCSDQLAPGVIADCAKHTLRQTTNALGEATFHLLGGAKIDYVRNPNGQACNCVKIYVDGENIVQPEDEPLNAGAFDLDDDSGVIGSDLAMWLDDAGNPGRAPLGYLRSDYDHSNADCVTGGYVDGSDLTIWLDAAGLGTGWGGSCAQLAGPPVKCTP
jgi:hypothetical protein